MQCALSASEMVLILLQPKHQIVGCGKGCTRDLQDDVPDDDMVVRAQLESRHWRGKTINLQGELVQTISVDGEAVVGAQPVIEPGVCVNYTSCTSATADVDLWTGWFTFVPGTIRCPKGQPFHVKFPDFKWADPSFIY